VPISSKHDYSSKNEAVESDIFMEHIREKKRLLVDKIEPRGKK